VIRAVQTGRIHSKAKLRVNPVLQDMLLRILAQLDALNAMLANTLHMKGFIIVITVLLVRSQTWLANWHVLLV
jgi:hypothetical protein